MSLAFLCSLLEACLMSLSLADIAKISEKQPLIGSIWKNFRENIQKPIAVILIINTFANTVGASLSGVCFGNLFGSKWIGLFSVVLALMIIQWSEIVPKTLGYKHNRLIARVFGFPLKFLVVALTPVLWITQVFARPFTGRRKTNTGDALDDINVLTRFAALNKLISKEQAKLVMKGIDLSKTKIADVMMPRDVIKFLASSMTLTDALIAAHHHYHTRYPLVETDSIDSVIGYVNFKDIVIALHINPKDPSLKGVMRPMLFVSDSESSSIVLNKMIQGHHHIAIAKNAKGTVSGLITLEDIIEEVIGEIQDEFDILPRFIRAMPDQRFQVGGATPLSDLHEKISTEFPDEPITLDAWMRGQMKKGPKQKDRITLQNYEILVSKIRRSQIHEAVVANTRNLRKQTAEK